MNQPDSIATPCTVPRMKLDQKGVTAFCTVLTRSHLEYGLLLIDSAKVFHPDSRFFVLIVDWDQSINQFFDSRDGVDLVHLDSLAIPNKNDFLFQYSPFELCNALKSFLLKHVKANHGYHRIIYLDSDILIYDRLDPIIEKLDSCGILLTPHVSRDYIGSEQESASDAFLQYGAYNAGVIAIGQCPSSNEFLEWWSSKMVFNCLDDRPRGFFVDQKYLDLVPGLFNDVVILKNPGINVGYFNIGKRPITFKDNRWHVGGHPLILFHFTQYNYSTRCFPDWLLSNQKISSLGDFRKLLDAYSDSHCIRNVENRPEYGFARHANGHLIPTSIRRIHGEKFRRGQLKGDPFSDHEYGRSIIHLENKSKLYGFLRMVFSPIRRVRNFVKSRLF